MLLFWFLASPLVCFMFNKFVESVSQLEVSLKSVEI